MNLVKAICVPDLCILLTFFLFIPQYFKNEYQYHSLLDRSFWNKKIINYCNMTRSLTNGNIYTIKWSCSIFGYEIHKYIIFIFSLEFNECDHAHYPLVSLKRSWSSLHYIIKYHSAPIRMHAFWMSFLFINVIHLSSINVHPLYAN